MDSSIEVNRVLLGEGRRGRLFNTHKCTRKEAEPHNTSVTLFESIYLSDFNLRTSI